MKKTHKSLRTVAPKTITRRGMLGSLLASSAAACAPNPKIEHFTAADAAPSGMFSRGVASGDPQHHRVIIWTHISPQYDHQNAPITVSWQIASNADFTHIVRKGLFETGPFRDWTVKVDVDGLTPGSSYFYRFLSGAQSSPIGRTRTLPNGKLDKLRLAVVSCANWQEGYFNVYNHIAHIHEKTPFDALIHLGDYLYEYGADKAPPHMALQGRVHDPQHEIITLTDYRTRHQQYRSDSALKNLTQNLPMIAIWDDHESSNDSWKDGAENHNSGEGGWPTRKEAAMRAYYEWMPVRDPAPNLPRAHFYRSFEWGDLATLTAVETRLLNRGAPIIIEDYFDMLRSKDGPQKFKAEILNEASRNMLGAAQRDYIAEQFAASKKAGKPWRILANQVVLGRLITPDLRPHVNEAAMAAIEPQWDGIRDFVELSGYGLPVYPDSWDGYPVARESLFAALKEKGVSDMLVLTGDAHEFWANDLTDNAGDKMGVELGTSSVSSETLAAFLGDSAADYALLMTRSNLDVRYYNPLCRGYIDLTIGRHRAEAKIVCVDSVDKLEYGAFIAARFTVKPRGGSLAFTAPKGLNMKQRALFSGIG